MQQKDKEREGIPFEVFKQTFKVQESLKASKGNKTLETYQKLKPSQ
jgi:hypothetical protein